MIDTIKSSAVFKHGQRRTKTIRHFLNKFLNDWSLNFAAMLAYNLLIALLPIAVALFGIFGLVLRNDTASKQKLKDTIINSFPADDTTRNGTRQVII